MGLCYRNNSRKTQQVAGQKAQWDILAFRLSNEVIVCLPFQLNHMISICQVKYLKDDWLQNKIDLKQSAKNSNTMRSLAVFNLSLDFLGSSRQVLWNLSRNLPNQKEEHWLQYAWGMKRMRSNAKSHLLYSIEISALQLPSKQDETTGNCY